MQATRPLDDPAFRRARARHAALVRWSRTTPTRESTARAREAWFQKFLNAVDDEEPGLDEQERHRRAELKVQAEMARLSMLRWHSRKESAA